jgi:hypothetical protein
MSGTTVNMIHSGMKVKEKKDKTRLIHLADKPWLKVLFAN